MQRPGTPEKVSEGVTECECCRRQYMVGSYVDYSEVECPPVMPTISQHHQQPGTVCVIQCRADQALLSLGVSSKQKSVLLGSTSIAW